MIVIDVLIDSLLTEEDSAVQQTRNGTFALRYNVAYTFTGSPSILVSCIALKPVYHHAQLMYVGMLDHLGWDCYRDTLLLMMPLMSHIS
jgi:hypothetical protein